MTKKMSPDDHKKLGLKCVAKLATLSNELFEKSTKRFKEGDVIANITRNTLLFSIQSCLSSGMEEDEILEMVKQTVLLSKQVETILGHEGTMQ
jgi:hypothetical protein